MSKLQGKILTLQKMSGSVSTPKPLSGNVGAKTINIGGRPYEGSYIVTPKVYQQKLETNGAIMEEDVTIKAIPFYKASNTSGGNTVYIAREI